MKVFKELSIFLPEDSTEDFFDKVESSLVDGWSREKEKEKESIQLAGNKFYFFSCQKQTALEKSVIAFTRKDDNEVYIANIIPLESSELTKDQYNSILRAFYNKFLLPIANKESIRIETTTDSQSMSDWVSEETHKRLKTFSRTSNKMTGSAHPSDQEKWFAFIVSVIRNNEKLDSYQLEEWLKQDEGWPQDVASDLAIQYEQGTALIRYYMSH